MATGAFDAKGELIAVEREREPMLEVDDQGRVVISFRSALKPGKYTPVAVHDKKVDKGCVTELPVEVNDLGDGVHVKGMLSRGMVQAPGDAPDPDHPFWDFALIGAGNRVLFTPVPGGQCAKNEELEMILWVYGTAEEKTPPAERYPGRLEPMRACARLSLLCQRVGSASA